MLKRIFRRLYEMAEILVIIGAINWGSIGIFRYDLVSKILGPMTTPARVFYSLIALSALWVIYAMIKSRSVSNPSAAPISHRPRRKN